MLVLRASAAWSVRRMCGWVAPDYHGHSHRSKWGCSLLRILLQDALSEVVKIYPLLKLKVFVDDITTLFKGRDKELTELADKVLEKLKKKVEEKDWKPSITEGRKEDKSTVVASCRYLEEMLREVGILLMNAMEELSAQSRRFWWKWMEGFKYRVGQEDLGAVALILHLTKAFERVRSLDDALQLSKKDLTDALWILCSVWRMCGVAAPDHHGYLAKVKKELLASAYCAAGCTEWNYKDLSVPDIEGFCGRHHSTLDGEK